MSDLALQSGTPSTVDHQTTPIEPSESINNDLTSHETHSAGTVGNTSVPKPDRNDSPASPIPHDNELQPTQNTQQVPPTPERNSAAAEPQSSPRPTKKSTVDELRLGLADLGLDVRGKRETLFRRLLNAVRRLAPSATPAPSNTDHATEASSATDPSALGIGIETPERYSLASHLATVNASSPATPSPRKTKPGKSGNTVYEALPTLLVPGVLESSETSGKTWGKQPCRSFLCFDVEATCRGGKEFSWPNEIIEFPVVLVQWEEEEADAQDNDGGLKEASMENAVEEASESEAVPRSPSSSVKPTITDEVPPTNTAKVSEETAKDETIVSEQDASTDDAIILESRPKPRPRLKIVDQFHSYVRPTWQPQLSEFCVNFTGITQETVDAAPTFPEVLKLLEAWLDKHGLRDREGLDRAMWVTDGPWDLRDFVAKQLHITPCEPAYPLFLRQPYLNIKQAFQTVLSEEHRRAAYAASHPDVKPNARAMSRITTGKLVGKDGQDRIKGLGFYSTITGMLDKLNLGGFEGRQHCGLDDATNVARILIALAERDPLFEPNAKISSHAKGRKKWAWMGQPGEVNWEEWMSDAKSIPMATSVEIVREPVLADEKVDEVRGEVEIEKKGAEVGEARTDGTLIDNGEGEIEVKPSDVGMAVDAVDDRDGKDGKHEKDEQDESMVKIGGKGDDEALSA